MVKQKIKIEKVDWSGNVSRKLQNAIIHSGVDYKHKFFIEHGYNELLVLDNQRWTIVIRKDGEPVGAMIINPKTNPYLNLEGKNVEIIGNIRKIYVDLD
jgi:hypothetical protein